MEKDEMIVVIMTDIEEARQIKSANYLNILPAGGREHIIEAAEELED